jgi:hypothetical protein
MTCTWRIAQRLVQPVEQRALVGGHRGHRGAQPVPPGAGREVVQRGQVLDRRGDPGEQLEGVPAALEPVGYPVGHRQQLLGLQLRQQLRVGHHRSHVRAAPHVGGDGEEVGTQGADVEQVVRGGVRAVDVDQRADRVRAPGDRRDVRAGADRGAGRRHRDQPGAGAEQLVVLPVGELAGLDVHLGPAHGHAGAGRQLHPGPHVGVVVEPADHHLVAGSPGPGQRAGHGPGQPGGVRPEDDAGGHPADQVGDGGAGAGDQPLRTGGRREDPAAVGHRHPHRLRHREHDVLGQQRAGRPLGVHQTVGESREQAPDAGDVQPPLPRSHGLRP